MMIGDIEKLLVKGEKVTLHVLGVEFNVTVKDVDISDYERKYLLVFADNAADTKWVNNVMIRQFQYRN